MIIIYNNHIYNNYDIIIAQYFNIAHPYRYIASGLYITCLFLLGYSDRPNHC